jgi:hypothetical protein
LKIDCLSRFRDLGSRKGVIGADQLSGKQTSAVFRTAVSSNSATQAATALPPATE